MADGKKISAMIRATEANGENLFETSQASAGADGGYITRAISMDRMAETMLNNMEYTSELETDAKKIIPAINELKNRGGGGSANAVLYTPQELTEAQKEQARQNIGAGTGEGGGGGFLANLYHTKKYTGNTSYIEFRVFALSNSNISIKGDFTSDSSGIDCDFYLTDGNNTELLCTAGRSQKAIFNKSIDLTSWADTVYLAFKHNATHSDNTITINIEEITIAGSGGGGGGGTGFTPIKCSYDDLTYKIVDDAYKKYGQVIIDDEGAIYRLTGVLFMEELGNEYFLIFNNFKGNSIISISEDEKTIESYLFVDSAAVDDKVAPVARDVRLLKGETAEIKADLTEQSESLDALWKLSKGQVWDIAQEVESGLATPPKGAKYETLLDVRGESRQNSTNGYQLLDIENLTYLVGYEIEDGIKIILSPFTLTRYNSAITKSVVDVLKPNTKYRLKSSVYGADFYAQLMIKYLDSGIEKNMYITTTQYSEINFDAPSDIISATFSVQAGVNGYSSSSPIDIYVMLSEGITDHDYEPYTGGIPSPNPDYPQEIHSVEEINIKKMGKNLFDKFNSEGIARLSFPVVAGRRVHCSLKVKNSTWDGNVYLHGKDGEFLFSLQFGTNPVGTVKEVSKIVPANSDVYEVRLYTDRSKVEELCISCDSPALPYEPYHEETTQIIPPFPLNRIGDYYDFVDIENGVWIKNTLLEPVTLTWSASANRLDGFITKSPLIFETSGKYQTIMADKGWFKSLNNNTGEYSIRTGINNNYLRVLFYGLESDNGIVMNVLHPMESESEPINPSDLEFLKSLSNMETENTNIIITDQDGNDISYLMEYIIKLSEVN